MTSHFQAGLPEFPRSGAARILRRRDVNHLSDVARGVRVSTLHDATGGRPSSSPRWHANMAYGGDQELVAALRTRDGQGVGVAEPVPGTGPAAIRPRRDAISSARSLRCSRRARRGPAGGGGERPEGPDGPWLVVLTADWEVESVRRAASSGWGSFPTATWDAGRSAAVLTVAGRALAIAERR